MWSRSLRNKKKEEGFTGAQQVYDCALDLLSYRDYSHKDMVERLQRKGATKAQALEAVAKLENYGLLNEERYAQLTAEIDNKKIYAAAGRFMAARGFSSRYVHIILGKLHFSDNI